MSTPLVLLLAFGLLVVGVFLAYRGMPQGKPAQVEAVRHPLGSAQSAGVTLTPGAARLVLTGQAQGDNLIEGTVQNLNLEQRSSQGQMRGNTLVYSLVVERPLAVREPTQWPQWSLKLSPKVPMTLTVKNPVSSSEIDLRGLRVVRLEVDAQVGHLNLTLPDSGVVSAKVTGGSSSSQVRVPRSMAVRVRVARATTGIIEVFGRVQPSYVSPDFERATDRVDLEVIGGASRIEIVRVR